MERLWWMAAALISLGACAGATNGAPTFSVGQSQGAFANPNDTPLADRRTLPAVPPGVVTMSPIPGESGVSNTSSVVSGAGVGR